LCLRNILVKSTRIFGSRLKSLFSGYYKITKSYDFQNLSKRDLNRFVKSADTTLIGKMFQIGTTLLVK